MSSYDFQNSSGRTSRSKNWFYGLEDPKIIQNTYVINGVFFWHGGSSYEMCKNSSEELLVPKKIDFKVLKNQ